ncbi:hypothetical protein GOBAR_AA30906 [Gossypium barbadense]|uniref:apyrase n=1 Tax=Gossypium barbadense TaxID=3634 RepID=A0A2P5WFB1_GOSBA|nr:hypothetical protein GOBAR_AA30906 [Gossypium barbadense]
MKLGVRNEEGKILLSSFLPSKPISVGSVQASQVSDVERTTPPWAASGGTHLFRPSLRDIQMQQGKQLHSLSHSPKTKVSGCPTATGQDSPLDSPAMSRWFKPEVEATSSIRSIQIEERAMKDLKRFYSSATAGLRALGGEASDKILQSVRELLKSRSTLKSEANGVKILDDSQEGSYEWSCLRCFHGGAGANWRNPRGFSGVTINYLLGNLGRTYQDTVGIVDLGGGSVQMAYAISKNAASRAPSLPAGQDNYVNEMYLKGSKYYLYVHSYLHYGLLATRAEILKATEDSGNPCILEGFDGRVGYW